MALLDKLKSGAKKASSEFKERRRESKRQRQRQQAQIDRLRREARKEARMEAAKEFGKELEKDLKEEELQKFERRRGGRGLLGRASETVDRVEVDPLVGSGKSSKKKEKDEFDFI